MLINHFNVFVEKLFNFTGAVVQTNANKYCSTKTDIHVPTTVEKRNRARITAIILERIICPRLREVDFTEPTEETFKPKRNWLIETWS